MQLEHLAKPIRVGPKTAPNRIVYQPTESNNADDRGNVTEATIERYVELAKGTPGILHVESLDVTKRTQARENRLLITRENLEGLSRLVRAIREVNRHSLVIFQLSHAGGLSDPLLAPPLYVYRRGTVDHAVGHAVGGSKSAGGNAVDRAGDRVLTTGEVEETVKEFVSSAVIAREAGADGIDLKQAHGFIAGDFLHPANRRPDRYGGSFENRTRFFRETVAGIRDSIKDRSFLVGTRISPYEGIPGGCGTSGPDEMVEDLAEMEAFAGLVEREGLDFINVSAGYASANLELLMPTAVYPEGVFRIFGWTRKIKETIRIPVIGSGYSYLRDGRNTLYGDSRPDERKSLLYWAEKNVRQGHTDFVGLGRQAIADPLFAIKVLSGRIADVNFCTACGGCGLLLGKQRKVGCVVHSEEHKRVYDSLR